MFKNLSSSEIARHVFTLLESNAGTGYASAPTEIVTKAIDALKELDKALGLEELAKKKK